MERKVNLELLERQIRFVTNAIENLRDEHAPEGEHGQIGLGEGLEELLSRIYTDLDLEGQCCLFRVRS